MRWVVPEAEHMSEGTLGCQGCGGALSMRLVLKEVGRDAVGVIPACCWSIIDGPWPTHALDIPILHTAFETAAVVAAGVKAAKTIQGKDTTVIAWAGDGGTFDIGLQALSGAAERNEDILFMTNARIYTSSGNTIACPVLALDRSQIFGFAGGVPT